MNKTFPEMLRNEVENYTQIAPALKAHKTYVLKDI